MPPETAKKKDCEAVIEFLDTQGLGSEEAQGPKPEPQSYEEIAWKIKR
jgi:hypothetical protein